MMGLFDMSSSSSSSSSTVTANEVDRFAPRPGDLRSFRVLWELLSRWTTPATVELILDYRRGGREDRHPSPMVDPSSHVAKNDDRDAASLTRNDVDIGASRRGGIMSMLKMHVPRSLSELIRARRANGHDAFENVDQKCVERRLADGALCTRL